MTLDADTGTYMAGGSLSHHGTEVHKICVGVGQRAVTVFSGPLVAQVGDPLVPAAFLHVPV